MTKTKDSALVPVERISHSILLLRGHRVILDRDLAAIYGVTTSRLNEAVKRNIWNVFQVVPCIGSLAALASVILIAVGINSDPRRQHWFDKFAGGTQVLKIG